VGRPKAIASRWGRPQNNSRVGKEKKENAKDRGEIERQDGLGGIEGRERTHERTDYIREGRFPEKRSLKVLRRTSTQGRRTSRGRRIKKKRQKHTQSRQETVRRRRPIKAS